MVKNSREGSCLAATYDDMQTIFKNSNTAYVVHGWVYSHKLDASIKHSWIAFSDKDVIYEPVNQIILDKNMQEFYKMRPVKTYTNIQMLCRSVKTGLKGGKFEF